MMISNDILIDAAINTLGYLLAGAFMVLIYSMQANKRNMTMQAAAPQNTINVVGADTKPAVKRAAKIEFVNFAKNRIDDSSSSSGVNTKIGTEEEFHKNRLQIMKQAKALLRNNRSQNSEDSEQDRNNQPRRGAVNG